MEPPSHLPHHYEHLLITIARLYGSTSSSEHLNLDLVLDYWNSADMLPTAATGSTSYHFRSSSRQVCYHYGLVLALFSHEFTVEFENNFVKFKQR